MRVKVDMESDASIKRGRKYCEKIRDFIIEEFEERYKKGEMEKGSNTLYILVPKI